MPLESIAFNAPVPFTSFVNHEHLALRFYAFYIATWQDEEKLRATPASRYYAASCTSIMPDKSTLFGADQVWPFLINQYGQFAKTERDVLSLILTSDSETGKHELHLRMVTKLYLSLQDSPVEMMQAFTYVIGKADEGAGTHGLQILELWNAYDKSVIERAVAKIKK